MGDPAGVGPELCVRALSSPEILRLCHPVVFGDLDVIQRASQAITLPLPSDLQLWNVESNSKPVGPAVASCSMPDAKNFVPGKVSAPCGAAGFTFIKTAIESALAGRIAAVVTAPIHKEALRLAGVQFPGHTEIFTSLTGASRTCMMLRSDVLTVSMVTTHIGYAEVPKHLSTKRIVDVIELTADALATMNNQPARLAICGLNPHAGEHGLFGQREEERFIEPAVAQAREKGIAIAGPLPPDTAFTADNRKRFDAVVCLYHDQGHIPFKMLAFDDGVNITLGLPIVRTSVDHGTAFDIAWKGLARPTSFFKAIESAVQLSAARQRKG
ncbi:MAG: 4-hydroxythreonine-4-phosphate dehydrogenase PdxA [Verrucomicrobia bacterium]|nr:4-hydroxythreonine-4-phosphate dehydrogenase PdxA [Verrucomicrobiota bacterium]